MNSYRNFLLLLFIFLISNIAICKSYEIYSYTDESGIKYSILYSPGSSYTYRATVDNNQDFVGKESNNYGVVIKRNIKFNGKDVPILSIAHQAFYKNQNLKRLSIQAGINGIGAESFKGCTSLEEVSILTSSNYWSLGYKAFEDCKSLKSVKFGSFEVSACNTQGLLTGTFRNCESLRTVELSSGLTGIEDSVFFNCKQLTDVKITIPPYYARNYIDLTKIGEAAFENCESLESIDLSHARKLKRIDRSAFRNCHSLKNINLSNCISLQQIGTTWSSSIGAFENCKSLENIDLQNDTCLTDIGPYTFKNCTSLTKVVLPRSLKSIGGYAFENCYNLGSVICYATEPPTYKGGYSHNVKSLFSESSSWSVLYVPKESVEKYKVAVGWKDIPLILPIGSSLPDDEIILNQDSISIKTGEQLQLQATVKTNKTDYEINWVSDNPNVATVENGLVTGISVGSTIVKAQLFNKTAICHVSVQEDNQKIECDKIELKHSKYTLSPGKKLQNIATVYPDNATDKTVTWTSSDSKIVSVDKNGLITAIAEGFAVVKAQCGKISATCEITVTDDKTIIEAEKIKIRYERVAMKPGQVVQNQAYIYPDNTTDQTVIWTSSDPKIASVDNNGLMTAIAEGFALVKAQCGKVSTTCEITVTDDKTVIEAEKIEIRYERVAMKPGQVVQNQAYIYPDNTTDQTVIWTSSDSRIVSVDKNGLMTAIAEGFALVKAQCGKVLATCEITVTDDRPEIEAEKIEVMYGRIPMQPGQVVQNYAYVYPNNTTDKTVIWTSSDSKIVSVDKNGLMTAIAEGFAVVKAQCGKVSATCEITVIDEGNNNDAPSIVWEQEFKCNLNDKIRLEACSPEGMSIAYRSIVPHGGYRDIKIEKENDQWYAYCINEGTCKIEAYLEDYPEITQTKVFNVIINPEELLFENGIYYRRIKNTTFLQVVRGYNLYEGDVNIPYFALGMNVKEIDKYAFYNSNNLNTVNIEEGIERLKESSFSDTSIKEIHIPKSVNYIAPFSFNVCTGIEDIYLYSSIPLVVDALIFNGYMDYETCKLHIPKGSYENYSNAVVWKSFLHIIEDSPIKEESGLKSPIFENLDNMSVYSTNGILIKKNCRSEDLKSLAKGIYIIVSGKYRFKISI